MEIILKIGDQEYTLTSGIHIVGRGDDADISLQAKGLSRMHVRFSLEDDKLFVEDLGSKNGTFVNGKKLDARHELVKGDKVRLADTECLIQYPQAAPAPALKSEAHTPRHRGARKKSYTPMIAAAIVIVIALIAYRSFANYVPPELKRARAALEAAETLLRDAEASADIDANNELLHDLDRLAADLGDIRAEFGKEYRAAQNCLDDIQKVKADIEAANSGMAQEAKAAEALELLLTQYSAGRLSGPEAMYELSVIQGSYPETKAGKAAIQKMIEVRATMLSAEKKTIADAATKARGLIEEVQFKAALALVSDIAARPFSAECAAELAELESLKAAVGAAAEKEFIRQADSLVAKARTGDCSQIRRGLKDLHKTMGFPAFQELLDERLAQVSAIQKERLVAARRALARDLAKAESLQEQRLYQAAMDLYTPLEKKISEPELVKELQHKIRYLKLLAAGKKRIITYVNGQGGVNIEGTGHVKKMREHGYTLEMEGVSMEFTWDKVRDGEFHGLVRKAYGTAPDTEGLVLLALLAYGRNQAEEGDRYLVKALTADAALKDAYPELCLAARERVQSRLTAALAPPETEGETDRGPVHLGSPKLEPGLKGRKDIIFFCHFESSSWYSEWRAQANERVMTVAKDPERKFEPFLGKALSLKVDKGGHYGASLSFKFKERIGKEPEEIYWRYYLRLGEDWAPHMGGKLPGIGGTYGRAGWGGRPVNGKDGWSARGIFRGLVGDKTPIGYYCYHADMKGRFGSDWVWEKDRLGYLENNRWYCIEQYVKMNTPGKDGEKGLNDGILRGWVDGKLAYDNTTVRFRDVDTLKIETIWANLYYGGTWTAPADMHIFMDNVVIARNYIGPIQRLPAKAKIAADNKKAAALLKMAREAETWQLDELLAQACARIIEEYPDSPAAGEARRISNMPPAAAD